MTIDRLGRGRPPQIPAAARAKTAEPFVVERPRAPAAARVTHAVVEDRESYVSCALEAATAHLHGTISVEDHAFIAGYLRNVIETDPALSDLVERVTHRAA